MITKQKMSGAMPSLELALPLKRRLLFLIQGGIMKDNLWIDVFYNGLIAVALTIAVLVMTMGQA